MGEELTKSFLVFRKMLLKKGAFLLPFLETFFEERASFAEALSLFFKRLAARLLLFSSFSLQEAEAGTQSDRQ